MAATRNRRSASLCLYINATAGALGTASGAGNVSLKFLWSKDLHLVHADDAGLLMKELVHQSTGHAIG